MKNECVALWKYDGLIIARIYKPGYGYSKVRFMFYSIKDVIWELRHKYSCTVSRDVIKGVYK